MESEKQEKTFKCSKCWRRIKRVEGCELNNCILCSLKLCQDCCDEGENTNEILTVNKID